MSAPSPAAAGLPAEDVERVARAIHDADAVAPCAWPCGAKADMYRRLAAAALAEMRPAAAEQREAETLIRLADAWDENASRWYYEHRHTHPNGIGWVGGFEEGWCEAARLLRARAAALDGTP